METVQRPSVRSLSSSPWRCPATVLYARHLSAAFHGGIIASAWTLLVLTNEWCLCFLNHYISRWNIIIPLLETHAAEVNCGKMTKQRLWWRKLAGCDLNQDARRWDLSAVFARRVWKTTWGWPSRMTTWCTCTNSGVKMLRSHWVQSPSANGPQSSTTSKWRGDELQAPTLGLAQESLEHIWSCTHHSFFKL